MSTTRTPRAGLDEAARLIRFAKQTLAILEGTPEWNSDTTDDIALAAMDLGVAATTPDGMFKSKVSNPKGQP